ncbi:MAG: hypothetical protein U9Q78_02650 [Chloroflexota bacterium]|nr:hypothetical protein [Chloroflexota bacterium]
MHEIDNPADIGLMQRKIERLETRLEEIGAILERILVIAPPVVFTMPDGSKRPFRPNRPVSLETLATMMRVEILSQERRHLSAEERAELLWRNIEGARAEAIEKGIAMDDEREAAIGD